MSFDFEKFKKNVIKHATDMAKEKGGNPKDYVKEAWEKERVRQGIKRKPIKRDTALLDGLFAKPDSVSSVFGILGNVDELPNSVSSLFVMNK